MKQRDVTKRYPLKQFISTLRRLIENVEHGRPFSIQVCGKRVTIPKHAICSVEHELSKEGEELEFQITWKHVRPHV